MRTTRSGQPYLLFDSKEVPIIGKRKTDPRLDSLLWSLGNVSLRRSCPVIGRVSRSHQSPQMSSSESSPAVRHSSFLRRGLTACRLAVKFSSGTIHQRRARQASLVSLHRQAVGRYDIKRSRWPCRVHVKRRECGWGRLRCWVHLQLRWETGDVATGVRWSCGPF